MLIVPHTSIHFAWSAKLSLLLITILSALGVAFSGVLSFQELFANGSLASPLLSCTAKTQQLFNLPTCVYGLAIYLLIFTLALLGYRTKSTV